MSPFVIAVLKYVFLGILYFFVFRAIRATVVDAVGRARDRRAEVAETRPIAAPRQPRPQRRARPPTSLVIKAEDGKRIATHRLSGPVQIGRAEACHIRIEDRYASQFHAKVYPRNGAWYAEDLGSTNGTYLNRHRLTSPTEVHAGDVLRIGKTSLELRR